MALFEIEPADPLVRPARGRVAALERDDTVTRCPYKGKASYHSVARATGTSPRT